MLAELLLVAVAAAVAVGLPVDDAGARRYVVIMAAGALVGALLLRVDVALPVLAAALVIALATASLRLDRTPPDATNRQGPKRAAGPTGTS